MLFTGRGIGTLRLFVAALYFLFISCLIQTAITLYLYAAQSVDTTISANLILTFVSSQLSLLFLFIQSSLARRKLLGLMQNGSFTLVKSICRALPRILIVLWIAAAAVGLMVASRQPRCRPGHAMQNYWQIGLSCRLHRAIVGMAVVSLVSICTVFCCIEVSSRPFHASLLGIVELDQDDSSGLRPSTSGLSWSSTLSADSVKREKIYQYRPMDFESAGSDRALWLQRRNSQSSQSAIYPPTLRYSSTGLFSSPGSSHQHRTPSSFLLEIPWSPPYHFNNSSSLMTSPAPSTFGNIQSFLPPTRASSTMSSTSRSTSSTSTRRSPLSTMRRASEPEVPIIPARFLDSKIKPQLQRSPTLPCYWSPSLNHAPLSADPAIRVFSTEVDVSPERPARSSVIAQQKTSTEVPGFLSFSQDLTTALQNLALPPDLPVRALGHAIPSKIAAPESSPINAPPPAVTYSTMPKVSSTLTSSNLHAKPALIQNKNSGNQVSTMMRPQPTQNPSSSSGSKTTSSNIPTDFASHNVMEARPVKRGWEIARSREVRAYGMGGATSITESKEGITSMRKARERGRGKNRACTKPL